MLIRFIVHLHRAEVISAVLHLHNDATAIVVIDFVELRESRLMIVGTEK